MAVIYVTLLNVYQYLITYADVILAFQCRIEVRTVTELTRKHMSYNVI